ncbi:MAG: sugar phosphate isomerase/epimerase, partial [Clostridia bacterium]|nr:sugar phosphate isomerase/epimerase [Clostridia bacterium]
FEGKIHCFHMKDCRIEGGKLTQCPIGEGMLDYDFILSTIKSYNPDAVLVLEGTVEPNIQRAVEIITKTW